MALITIETQSAFLQKVFIDYIALWKKCFNNLNNILIWLSFILMIIALPLFIAYLLFYSVFLICSFGQNFDNLPSNTTRRIFVIIFKILLTVWQRGHLHWVVLFFMVWFCSPVTWSVIWKNTLGESWRMIYILISSWWHWEKSALLIM